MKPNIIKYFSYIFICIAIIGSVETLYVVIHYIKKSPIIVFTIGILSWIFHLALLYPLVNPKEYLKPNIYNYILGLIGILIIIYLPYWPYMISRNTFIIYILSIFSILSLTF